MDERGLASVLVCANFVQILWTYNPNPKLKKRGQQNFSLVPLAPFVSIQDLQDLA